MGLSEPNRTDIDLCYRLICEAFLKNVYKNILRDAVYVPYCILE